MSKSYKKKSYLSDDEIYNLEVAIYNDDVTTFTNLLSKTLPYSSQKENAKLEANAKSLVGDQEYEYIGDTHYIITQRGEVYNVKHLRVKGVQFLPHDFVVNMHQKAYKISEIMEDVGYTFDYNTILKHYTDRGYKVYVTKSYKEKYEQAIYQ